MNNEIQSYAFHELIKYVLFVSVILRILDSLILLFPLFSLFRYFCYFRQTYDISIKFVHNY